MNRREILFGGTAFGAAIAGCLQAHGRSEDGATSATDAVEQYFLALREGDRERANHYAHPDGEYYLDDENELFLDAEGITIDETETVDVETGVRHMHADPDEHPIDEFVEEERAALESLQDEYGFDDYAYVRHDAEAETLTFNSIYVLFEDDDGWAIWSLPTILRER
ncbi:hypothetical protein [Natronobacterium texcoconense]|uniref:Uncharacterized protein n=1 Tax=Natronobacterium texcoconense TaxID=1095778 RepID=A0A1H1ID84_NATTX|nr:hypothetical protein [Natronobacterium texcoconense]SDR35677.1 hypothetical protein SAMN04489842_3455 [Natronobacterium texcoconense]